MRSEKGQKETHAAQQTACRVNRNPRDLVFSRYQNLYLRPIARRSVETSAFPLSNTAPAGVVPLQCVVPAFAAGLAMQKDASC